MKSPTAFGGITSLARTARSVSCRDDQAVASQPRGSDIGLRGDFAGVYELGRSHPGLIGVIPPARADGSGRTRPAFAGRDDASTARPLDRSTERSPVPEPNQTAFFVRSIQSAKAARKVFMNPSVLGSTKPPAASNI